MWGNFLFMCIYLKSGHKIYMYIHIYILNVQHISVCVNNKSFDISYKYLGVYI